MCQGEERNPIKQDVKKGVPRFYPYTIPWNYGMLPQTWEDPKAAHADLPGVGVMLSPDTPWPLVVHLHDVNRVLMHLHAWLHGAYCSNFEKRGGRVSHRHYQ